MGKGQRLYKTAKERIPGGTQLLSKRPEMYLPGNWPAYYARAKGAEVWDLDGKRYIDMATNSVGACVLGVGDPDVDAAVRQAIDNGVMSSLNCPEEVELAELLCELHPWAEMVRYARTGGEAMAVAVRIARTAAGRNKLAFCGYHGWHDWYIAANLGQTEALDGHLLHGLDPAGVPRNLAGTALPFRYNHLEELEAIVETHGHELAAIVMEPIRSAEPDPGFLEGVRRLADKVGAVLVFDEITSGFRLTSGGAHLLYGVTPDIAVFAKSIGNGYPMAAIIGNRQTMQAAQDSFISSTYWTERIGPAAAIATIRKHCQSGVASRLAYCGRRVKDAWREHAAYAGLDISVSGIDPLASFAFNCGNPRVMKTLFTQQMLDEGFLASTAFYATFAHTEDHLAEYEDALARVFPQLADALDEGNAEARLRGPIAHAGFQRLT